MIRLIKAGLAGALLFFSLAASPSAGGGEWPWAAASDQILGTAALVAALDARGFDSAPAIDRLRFYACAEPGCREGQPLDLLYTGPRVMENRTRFHYLALDLPPGGYRLAQVEGSIRLGRERVGFSFPLHYIFYVRQGSTAYLGRLNLTLRPKGRYFEIVAVEPSTVAGPKGRIDVPALTFDFAVTNEFAYDATALLRAFPGRRFFEMSPELMVWLEK